MSLSMVQLKSNTARRGRYRVIFWTQVCCCATATYAAMPVITYWFMY